jgi:predicted HNH restriction endonuclease
MKNEYGELLLEKHSNGHGFLGLYIRHSPNGESEDDQLSASTIALLQDVYAATAGEVDDSQLTSYPQHENRRIVVTHLRRERSRILSLHAKLRDKYRCRVCDMTFREHYGPLGDSIAEAHHLVPLSQLKAQVKTSVEDLITVCANCHTMLHRMGGERHDYQNLRRILKQRRRGSRR